MTKHILLVLATIITLAGEIKVHATAYTSTGSGGGWGSSSTWTPSGVPGSSDTAAIAASAPVSVSDAEAATSVTIQKGATLTIATGGNLTVSGTITQSGGSSGTSTLTLAGGSGTLTLGSAATAFTSVTLTPGTSGSIVVYTASAATVYAAAYQNLTLSGGGIVAVNSTTTVAGALTLSGTTAVSNASGKLASIGSLSMSGSSAFTATTTTTISGSASFSGTSTFTRTAATTISGDLTVSSSASYLDNNGNSSLTANGNISVASTATFGGATGFGNNSTLILGGTSKTISGGGVLTNQQITVNGSYTLQSGTTISVGNKNAGITPLLGGTGSLVNQGTLIINYSGGTFSSVVTIGTLDFSTAGNTYVLDAAGSAAVATLPTATYYNLVFNPTGGSAQFNLSGATINGNVTFGGTSGSASGLVTAWPASIAGALTFNSSKAITLPSAFACASFNQSAGTVTVPSAGTLTITSTGSGTFTRSGGTFTTTGGTVSFNGAAPQISGTSGTTFNNLTFNDATGASLSVATTVNGTLTLTSGTLAASANLTLGSSASLAIAGGATLDVSGGAATFTLPASGMLSASGSGTSGSALAAINGNTTVNCGTRPVTLTWGGGTSGTDSTHPALVISQGALTLGGNAITLNGTQLTLGTYRLIQVGDGSTGTLNYSASTITGTAVASSAYSYALSASTGDLVLTVEDKTTTTCARTMGSSSQTYGSALTFTATVSDSAGGSTPTGNVIFKDGSTTLATVALSSGSAAYTSYTDIKVPGSPHAIAAYYQGDSTHGASDSAGSPVAQTITAKALTVSGLTANNKTYDGTTNATLSGTAALSAAESPGSGSTADGLPYTGDTVNLTGTPGGYFASAGPGNGIGVSVTGLTLAGGQAGDYSLMLPSLSANITASSVTVNLYSSENPSGYNDSVTLTATNTSAGSTPTGSVVFLNNGTPFSTNTVDGNGAARATTTTLPRGTNTIEADFSGTGAFAGVMATNTLNQVVTNHPPVAMTMTVTRTAGLSLKIALSDVATNWTDPDGDSVSLAGINLTTTNGVNLSTNSGWIVYPTSPNVNDQISYAIADGFGGTNIGYINIILNASVTGMNSIVGITTGSTNVVTAYGIPGYNYILERATNMASVAWVDVSTNAAASNGAINATDDFSDLGGQPPVSAFYRLKWQP